MDHSKQLGEQSVGKLLWKFSIPAIVGMLVNALYNIIDRIFVGRGVGLLGISATTIAFPVSIIIMAFGMLIGIGAAATVSIRLGQKKKEEAEKILGNAFTMLVIISILVTVLGLIFEEPLLIIFGASEEVLPLAKEFVTIILIGVLLQNIGFGLNNIIRSEGNPKIAMLTMLIGAILNTIFNPIFIFGLDLGIRGSALATIVSQTVCSAWVLSYFMGKKSVLKLRIKNLKLDLHIIKQIVAIGMSPFLMQIVASGISITFNKDLKMYGGDTAIAAFGIINSVVMLILMPIFGINQGSQPIIGYNYGAGNFDRVKKALKLAILAATTVSTLGFVIVELFPRVIISVFSSNNADLINIGSSGIRIFLLMMPIVGFQIVSANYFQAINKAKIAIFLSLSRQVIILLPLLLILPNFLKLTGVWVSGATADLLASIVTAAFLFKELRHLGEASQAMEQKLGSI
ncbi:MATE family efflux transporter [Clostridium magnum]|uniref:Multidrug export protein MepA n=1 Tax=Clostridium magnum DSM 2767 TaxID=1121326 RepID=A0A162T289_9CLOT|nr:MATE family efflux transporter [Clostridium magnum]KZL92159.1 multidrug export protein MepA [Clostridium magnum DSM 2767]SHH19906.1 putative efflux protein, MATE family [Clostridium magnum DSM 2767]